MSNQVTEKIFAALQDFCGDIYRRLNTSIDVWPEDQLKPPIDQLLQQVGSALGKSVDSVTEAPQSASDSDSGGSRVDIAVRVGPTDETRILTGHMELKAPGRGAIPSKFRDRANKKQWEKFKKLPNLIYTDGRQWTLHHTGEMWKKPINFTHDPVEVGRDAVTLDDAIQFELMFSTFFSWDPIVPRTSKQIADLLAPLSRLMRTEAEPALNDPDSSLSGLAKQWRKYLFPGATNEVVADTYAQTFTYALIIARFEGADPLSKETAEKVLSAGHGLLSEVLGLLSNPAAYNEVKTSADLLLRVIAKIDPNAIVKKDAENPWLYFYEEFLGAYDAELRKKVGAYYTPVEVVSAQTNIINSLLKTKFQKTEGFADPSVITLDPAVGTGTYPLRILESVAEQVPSNAPAAKGPILRRAARNLYGFEYLIGPYSVAHLRLSRFLEENGVSVHDNDDVLNMLLADTLASHEENDTQTEIKEIFGYESIYQEREEARALKTDTRVVVCLGNPPYLRGKKTDTEHGGSVGGWVTMRREPRKNTKVRNPKTGRMIADPGEVGIISDFLDPARETGNANHIKNLYNAYVYFWRWAMWKVFEQENPNEALYEEQLENNSNGIISFITASSFLRGPGFVGMRQHMRETFDEIWIIDLGGDNKGGRKTENVFSIETPVAITTGVRYGKSNPDEPAHAHYLDLSDYTAEEKKSFLNRIVSLEDKNLHWRDCLEDWMDPLLPAENKTYLSWPELTDIFPWQVGGPQVKRSWPIGETKSVLEERWEKLTSDLELSELSSNQKTNTDKLLKQRRKLFHETRDRKINRSYTRLFPDESGSNASAGDPEKSIAELKKGTPPPPIMPYAYRSFDRQYILADNRLGDYLRKSLWTAHSEGQIYLTSMLTGVVGEGPAAVAATNIPDLDSYRGSFGGKHVIPLWKDKAGEVANITVGLLPVLNERLGTTISPEKILQYCYGLLAMPSYVEEFWEPLTIPGPRIPITTDLDLFNRVSDFGGKLMGLHTFGERYSSDQDISELVKSASAKYTVPIPTTTEEYPEEFSYEPETRVLSVGKGRFENVPTEVWEYSVSGMQVISSWLAYRMEKRAGRGNKTPLDQIRPKEWPDPEGKELLTVMAILEESASMRSEGAQLLQEVLASELIHEEELPVPNDYEREELVTDETQGELDFTM